MKKLVLVLLIAFIVSNVLCKSEKEEVKKINLSSSITFDIPSSVSAPQTELKGSLSAKNISRIVSREDDGTGELLDGVRLFANIGEMFAVEAKKFFLEMEAALGPIIENKEWVESQTGGTLSEGIVFDDNEDGQNNRIEIAITDNSRHIKVWLKDVAGNPKAFEASWQGTVQDDEVKDASGTLYMNGAIMGMPAESIIKMEFNTNDDTWGHSMVIQSAGFYNAATGDDIDNMYLFAAKKDSEVVLVGNAYFPSFGDNDEFFEASARNYVYSASSDIEQNIGVMRVALPLTSTVDQDYDSVFQDYSVGAIYKQSIWDWLHSAETEPAGILAALEADIPTGFGADSVSTVDKLETVLSNSVFDDDLEVQNLRYAFALGNPVYMDSAGYIGNGESNEPEGYSTLAANVDNAASELKSLSDVANLKNVLWSEFFLPSNSIGTMPTDDKVKSLE